MIGNEQRHVIWLQFTRRNFTNHYIYMYNNSTRSYSIRPCDRHTR